MGGRGGRGGGGRRGAAAAAPSACQPRGIVEVRARRSMRRGFGRVRMRRGFGRVRTCARWRALRARAHGADAHALETRGAQLAAVGAVRIMTIVG